MKYGELPKELELFKVDCKEMMFYQYLPIKMKNEVDIKIETRLDCFDTLFQRIMSDFITEFGFGAYANSYVYVTARYMYQLPDTTFNREGYHSDGFLTDDINYIWCDKYPTIFNKTLFNLISNDKIAIKMMECQAESRNEISYQENQLLRLNQFNIHKVAPIKDGGMRTFLKVSFSKDKYDLIGNSHNYLFNYNWDMKPRNIERNIPQSILIK